MIRPESGKRSGRRSERKARQTPVEPPSLLTDESGTQTRLQGLVIIALAIWIFSPVLRGDWLWDDFTYISRNPFITDPAGLGKILTHADGLGNYDPLTSAVRWLQWQCLGDNTLGYHLTNVGLHVASAFLLWRLFHRLQIPMAWLGALIFTVHPLMVESVAWIAELKNTLSLPPLLLAMLAFVTYDESRRRTDYFQALAWFVVAMLAKTSGFMLPVVLLGYAWWKRGKISMGDIKTSVPFFLIAMVAILVSISPHTDSSGHDEIVATGGLAARLASVGWAGLFLLGKVLLPMQLMPVYSGISVETPTVNDLLPWLLLVAALGVLWNKRKTWGLPILAGLGFFLVNLVPVFGFIVKNYSTMVWSMDHLIYLPVIGLIGLVVFGASEAIKHFAQKRSLINASMLLLVAVMAFISHGYAETFLDEETLWRYSVERNPNILLAQEYLGKVLLRRGHPEEAEVHFEVALRLNPKRAPSHDYLGQTLVQMGKAEQGIAEYQQALALEPTNSEVENNLGVALMQQNKLSEAVDHLTRAVQLKSDYALAYDNLGVALAGLGRNQQAVNQFTKVLQLTPGSVPALDNLGNALLQLGQKEEAKMRFQQALQIAPDDAKALKGLKNSSE